MIDWDDLKNTYNRTHNTNFETTEEWIVFVYNRHNKFVGPLANELGLGFNTVKTYLQKIGIWEKKLRGGNNYKNRPLGKKEAAFLSIPEDVMKDLTKYQICKRCMMSQKRCTLLIKKHKRKCTKGYGDTTNEWT